MNINKIISGLEYIKKKWFNDELSYWGKVLVEAIHQLTYRHPIEPMIDQCGRDICPTCDHKLKYGHSFCHRCGQAIKWR